MPRARQPAPPNEVPNRGTFAGRGNSLTAQVRLEIRCRDACPSFSAKPAVHIPSRAEVSTTSNLFLQEAPGSAYSQSTKTTKPTGEEHGGGSLAHSKQHCFGLQDYVEGTGVFG